MTRILAAAIGSCIHVAGTINFLHIASQLGYTTRFLGPAVPVDELIEAVIEYDPDMVGVSYRLTPQNVTPLLEELKELIATYDLESKHWIFGGTEAVVEEARKSNIFCALFSGRATMEDVISFLKREPTRYEKEHYPQTLMERILLKRPFPILRHHFGLPSLKETIKGIQEIAQSGVVDVISIAPDQNTQESFFRPQKMTEEWGSGGVPLRSEADFRQLYAASRCGNHPLLRCYSGTRDLLKMSDLLYRTINNAWSATPLTWYSVLDMRSRRPLKEAIVENQENMRWNARREIPVEVNESHQWSLRNAHDTLAVAMAYLAAYNAKKMGVTQYVSQYMFNSPLGTSPLMDLAKMLAKIELIESLHDETFTSLREVRVAGLLSYPVDPHRAKGQLAASVYVAMALHPDIVHAVSYSEATHAATAQDVIKTCKITKQVIQNCLLGMPDMTKDPRVITRKEELISEARILLEAIHSLGEDDDPFTSVEALEKAVCTGLLDTPHFKGNPAARGEIRTALINGACYAMDEYGEILTEESRIRTVLEQRITE
jgi:methylmalonyl-CoA mutase cobalamin-binding subunit